MNMFRRRGDEYGGPFETEEVPVRQGPASEVHRAIGSPRVQDSPPRLFDGQEPREEYRRSSFDEESLWGHSASLHHSHSLDLDEPETILGEGICVRGEIAFQRYLRIDGQFEGSELSGEGKLVVGSTGLVKADISLSEAIIEGRVEGNISVDRLELRGDAKVYGSIRARLLTVEEGATLSGSVDVTPREIQE